MLFLTLMTGSLDWGSFGLISEHKVGDQGLVEHDRDAGVLVPFSDLRIITVAVNLTELPKLLTSDAIMP